MIEKNISSVSSIDRGGGNDAFFLGKKQKKYSIVFHYQLEQHFPNWNPRMDYQKKQEELYKSAMQKRRETLRARLEENFNRTREEQDAINYFHETGIYAKYQDPETRPNIFDTRQSFLLKMHDREMRGNFLNSFNREKN